MRGPLRFRSGGAFGVLAFALVGILALTTPATALPAQRMATDLAAAAAPDDPPADDEGAASELKIETDLAVALAEKDSADFYVDFAERADLAAAAAITDWDERGAAVVEALQATADASQAELRKQLDEAQVDYTSFWISNTVLVRGGTQELAQQAAQLTEVATIHAPGMYEIPEPAVGLDEQTIDAVEWGIDRIQADDVWSTFGIRGEGIVIGSIDSGVNFQHPALAAQYRGNSGRVLSHDYNWFDPSDVCPGDVPCDNNNHGSHVMGTMVGSDGGANQIGVAPRARWVAAKGCETNFCSEAALLASGQWMLAPTRLDGTGADPALRPHIVNNSWGGSATEPWYRQTIDNWRAAGIFPAFSNGNGGSACNTAGNPGSEPGSFASGSFDINNAIASTSSRGNPASGLIKPNLAAPGVNVRSSVANGGYASFSGTSMASPHTAGTVALLWSAAPALTGDIPGTIALLNQTAVDTADLTCGGTAANNNVWGEGKLNALAAVTAAPRAALGTLVGTVTDAGTGAPLAGAQVAMTGPFGRIGSTGPDGTYTLVVPIGDYTVAASAFGYQTQSATVAVGEGQPVQQDLALPAAPTGAVSGFVTSPLGPVAGATVTILGLPLAPATTAADGSFAFPVVPFGSYRISAVRSGCFAPAAVDLLVDGDETTEISLPPRVDGYGYTCQIETAGYVEGDTPLEVFGDEATTAVDLPFPFFLYGQQYRRAFLSTNGHLNFVAAAGAFTNGALPAVAVPNAAIYPFWDDLNVVRGTGQLFTKSAGVAPNRSFLVEWRNVAFFNDQTGLRIDVQVQLNEDGTVVTRYRNLGPAGRERGDSATVGIENASGTVALQYSFNAPVLSDAQSIRFVPPPTGVVTGVVQDANDALPIAGASVRALQGTAVVSTGPTEADGSYSLRLKPGAYTVEVSRTHYRTTTASVEITAGGQAVLPFSLDTPVAALTPDAVSFLANEDQLRTARLTLSNPTRSDMPLTYTLTDGQSWLWTVPATGSIAPGGSRTLTVRADATGIAAGVHTGSIAITTNAGRTPSRPVLVTMVVPRFRQGVDAGGAGSVDTAGDPWGADQAWTPGGHGYLGTGWTSIARQPIGGTEDDVLHQTVRESTSGYRFDSLPAGTYLVEVDFVEVRRILATGRRVFDVSINGAPVLERYDPVAAVGTLALDRREFWVTVAQGGAIAVDFGAIRGKLPPAVAAVRITHRPDV